MTTGGAFLEKVLGGDAPRNRLDALLASSGRPAFRTLAWLVMAVVSAFFLWAGFAQLDEVSSASGEVIPSAKVKVVQHLEGGIIEELEVTEGAAVKQGQVLLQLALGGARASREELQVQLDALVLTRERLKAEMADAAPAFPQDVAARRPELVLAESATLDARKAEMHGRLGVARQKVTQRELEIKELEARQRGVEANLRLGRERLRLSGELLKSGLTPRMEHLEIQREIESLTGESKVLEQTVPRAKAALAESRAFLEEEREGFRRRAVEELSKTELQLARVQESLTEASDRVRRTEIRSPIDGIVKNMRFHTIGGVVRPGEPIMEIVPVGDKLVIEARLSPVDRGYVQTGQKAVVKISTYDFVRYGGLDGVVERIAADTNTDTSTGQPYYVVIVRTEKTFLGDRAGEFPITPGMQATVDIHTGSRSVLNYLVKPVLKLRNEAFRER
jgi:adhesin transport system membrane fusion protein